MCGYIERKVGKLTEKSQNKTLSRVNDNGDINKLQRFERFWGLRVGF